MIERWIISLMKHTYALFRNFKYLLKYFFLLSYPNTFIHTIFMEKKRKIYLKLDKSISEEFILQKKYDFTMKKVHLHFSDTHCYNYKENKSIEK